MNNTPETNALREAIDNGAATEAEMTSLAGKLERERDEAREALADIALMDTSGLAASAVSRALRSLGQWKDILDAKTTRDLRQSTESAK